MPTSEGPTDHQGEEHSKECDKDTRICDESCSPNHTVREEKHPQKLKDKNIKNFELVRNCS